MSPAAPDKKSDVIIASFPAHHAGKKKRRKIHQTGSQSEAGVSGNISISWLPPKEEMKIYCIKKEEEL